MLILAGVVGEPFEDKYRILGYKVYELESQSLTTLSREEAESGALEIIGLEDELKDASLYGIDKSLMSGVAFDEYGDCMSSLNLLPVFDSEYDSLISMGGLKDILTVFLYELDPVRLVIDLESLGYSLSVEYSDTPRYNNGYHISCTTSDEDDILSSNIKNVYEYTEYFFGCFSLGSIAVIDYSKESCKNLVLPKDTTEICLSSNVIKDIEIVVPPNVTKIAYSCEACYIPDFKLYISKNSDISLITNILIRQASMGGLEVVKPINYDYLTYDNRENFNMSSDKLINKLQTLDYLSLSDIIDDLHSLGVKIELY